MTISIRTAVAAAAFISVAGSAFAADPVDTFVEDVTIVPSVYDWSGVYLGVQGGYGWAEAEIREFGDPDEDADFDGFFLGGIAGYNAQSGNIVFGVEADFNAGWLELDEDDGDEVEIDWFGSVRGRLGYAWDRTMVFATGGIAFAHIDIDGAPFDFDFTGWTVGAGVEHAFTDNWLARAEYRYYDFGDDDLPFNGGTIDLDMHTVSLGVVYKF